ncbi:MAG: ABC transporter permease, partial [Spirochaetota bacterium]|nr:ABC transporter permease [Spirochaetota bacterium]
MLKFLFSRFVQSIIVFFLLSIIIFSLIDYMPGDPLKQFKRDNPDISEKEIDDFKKKKGLDKSFIVRYLNYMCRFLPEINFKDNDFKINWNFGISSRYQVEVSYLLKERIITTLNLTIPVFILSLIVAIPIGIFSAVYQYSKFDYLMSLFTFIGISLPTFWLGLMLIYIFSLQFQVFPASGIETINVSSFIDQVKHFVLPIFVLSIHRIGSLVRFFRGSLLDVLKLDYIRTARAKGLSEDVVIF